MVHGHWLCCFWAVVKQSRMSEGHGIIKLFTLQQPGSTDKKTRSRGKSPKDIPQCSVSSSQAPSRSFQHLPKLLLQLGTTSLVHVNTVVQSTTFLVPLIFMSLNTLRITWNAVIPLFSATKKCLHSIPSLLCYLWSSYSFLSQSFPSLFYASTPKLICSFIPLLWHDFFPSVIWKYPLPSDELVFSNTKTFLGVVICQNSVWR